ncbi:MAG TPA: tyrosine-type recombinase/integrase [Ktedonobacteraceae bacterium]|nr:tyrosine-type recombinase/integrase [Ktedonobacteraceae bacterium]
MVAAKSKTVLAALAEYEYVIMELADSTQQGYKTRLGRFARWCQTKRLFLKSLTPAIIAGYLQELRKPSERTGDPLSTYTLHGHMRAIRAFLYWCAKPPQKYLSLEVPQNLVMPKVDIKVIQPFQKEHITRIQVAITHNHFPIMVARDKAIFAVLLDTGIRAAELCGLLLEHVYISPQEAYIKVTGKGRKQREVPLGKKSRLLLREYIKHYRPQSSAPEVFLGHKFDHSSLTTNALRQVMRRWSHRAKVSLDLCHPHTCRHTFAINFLLQGGDLYVLSRLLGHSSVAVTEVYLRAVEALQARKIGKSVLDNL